jgi:TorA maturation chaperone TorD
MVVGEAQKLTPGLPGHPLPNGGLPEKADLALARAGSYRLLARLFRQELDQELLTFLGANAGFLGEIKLPDEGRHMEWLQTLRVEYARLFVLNVYPFASIYTGPEVMLNTAQTEQVRKFYSYYDFDNAGLGSHSQANFLPDHLAIELGFMANLAETEGRYWQAGNPASALSIALAEQTFLEKHLLTWLPVFGLAVERASRQNFYPALVKQSLDFICQDFQYLLEQQSEAEPQAVTAPLEEAEPFFTDFGPASPEKEPDSPVSLKQFVSYLITPAKSGLYLSKIELFRLAHSLQLPVGVTERFQMLESLLRDAFDYQMVEPLLAALRGVVQASRLELAKLEQTYPQNAFIWQLWKQRLNRSWEIVDQQFLSNQL